MHIAPVTGWRRFALLVGALGLIAIAAALFWRAEGASSPALAAIGGPEMVLNIKGGDCDDPVRPTECNVALGADFTLSVDALAIPPTGYSLLQTYIHFGDYLRFVAHVDLTEEIVWPDCSAATAHREPDLKEPFAPDDFVAHSCLTAFLGSPLPTSSFVGTVLAIDMSCTIAGFFGGIAEHTSTLVRLADAISGPLGSRLLDLEEPSSVTKVGDLLVNCGAGGPLATPTFTPTIPPTLTPQPTPTGATPTPTATPTPLQVTKGNDDFADAISIPGPLPFGNVQEILGASIEPGEPSPCVGIARTVWFSYTPPGNVVLTADTVGSDGDSALAVYTGPNLSTLADVACDDNSGPNADAEVTVNAAGGTTYYFQIAQLSADSPDLAFNLHELPAKGNDDFAGAVVISGPLPYSNKDDAGGATLEPGEPRPCADIDNTVWYSYTPASSGVLAVDTNGSDYDTAIAVYTGSSLGSLLNVACDNDAGFLTNSRIAFVAQAGVNYYFQVGGALDARGNAVLNLSAETAPIKGNDNFANAAVIGQPLPFSNKVDTAGATLEPGEPQGCGPTAGTVWYKLTPDTDVIISNNAAVYTGDALTNLSLKNCGFRFFVASAGQTYYFQLGGCALATCTESFGSLEINLPDFPCLPGGCPELAFSIPGGDCDDPVRPQACNVPLGSKFNLLLSILGAPVQGYELLQSFISYGSLLYDMDQATLQQEVLWPGCAVGLRFQDDANSNVGHGCLTGLLPPLPASFYIGPFIQLSMSCPAPPTSSELLLLPEGHPSAGTSGTLILLGGDGGVKLLPEVSALTIRCVEVTPVAVGGVALDGELRGIAGHDGTALWLWVVVAFGVIVSLSALAIARRRLTPRS